jgi:hypothetical protein
MNFFGRPIRNSPYAYPDQHWELDSEGQPTNRIVPSRRRSDLITPVSFGACILQGYRGWMHADGCSGFSDLYRSGGVREVACLAHMRRRFVDVFQSKGSVIAGEAIQRIAGLYAVEMGGRGRPPRTGCGYGKRKPSRSSMSWRRGGKRSCPGSPASPSWPRRSSVYIVQPGFLHL